MAQLKELLLSRQVAEEFYREQREEPFFNQLLEFMCRFVRPLPRPRQTPETSSSFFWGGAALSTIISTTQNEVGLSFTVYTQIDAQTEISSAPAEPFAGLLRKCSATKSAEQGEGQGQFEQGDCIQVRLEI